MVSFILLSDIQEKCLHNEVSDNTLFIILIKGNIASH